MPRRQPSRKGVPQLARPPSGYTCLGGDKPVSAFRLCCPRCWARLPPKLRVALSVPKGTSPHHVATTEFLAAKDQAAAWLTKDREMANG